MEVEKKTWFHKKVSLKKGTLSSFMLGSPELVHEDRTVALCVLFVCTLALIQVLHQSCCQTV